MLAQYLGDTGLDLERYEARPGRENLVARIEGSDPTAPTLLLMGHTDVVPVNPDGWQRDPFGGEIVDDEIWGRGAVDMLNLTATMAVAFRDLARSGFTPRGTLVYLAVADEENLGTWGAGHLVEHERDAVQADYVVTEAGGFQMPTANGPRLPVIVGEKGSYWCRITVKGTPGHASQPFRTDNALVTAAEVVRRLAEFRPPTEIHETWRRFIEGVDFGPEWTSALLDEEHLSRVLRAASDRARTPGARLHAHDLRAHDHPRRHQDERDPRPGRRGGRHPHAARPDAAADVRKMLDDALGDLAAHVEIMPFDENESTVVARRLADVGLDGSGLEAPRRGFGARALPHRRRDRRPVLPAQGLGRVRIRPLQPAALVRRLRLDVPRQRRTRRSRVARALDPPLGRSRPRPRRLRRTSSADYSSPCSRR